MKSPHGAWPREGEDRALSLSLLRATLESTTDGILVVDRAGRIEVFNRRFAELWRIPVEILEQRDDEATIRFVLGQLADPDGFVAKVHDLYAHPDRDSFDVLTFRDGRIFERYSCPQRIEDETVGRVWSFRDVTVRVRAEQALRESEARFRSYVENAPLAVFVADLEARFVDANPAALELLGCTREELLSLRVPDLPWDVGAEAVGRVLDRLRTLGQIEGEFRLRALDGRPIWVSLRAVRFGEDRLMGFCQDVTSRRVAEEAQVRSQKLQALGTLAGGIAHDFNNILQAIRGNIELARLEIPEGSPARGNIDELAAAAGRAAQLVKRILGFTRPQEQARERLDLALAVGEALALVRASTPQMVELSTSFASDAPPVLADPGQIHQVVVNLATNAAQAIGARPGRVAVSVDRVETAPGADSPEDGPWARLVVADDGCGMSPETLARAFDPFFTTKGPGEGTGLGLSMVHAIVESHGGRVRVASVPGDGSTFEVFFRACPSGPGPFRRASDEALPAGSGRILFVDDEPAIVALASRMLRRLGYAPAAFADAAEALAAFRADPASFVAAVTDLSMPRMSGLALLRELRAERPDLPVFLASGNIRPEDEETGRSLGVSGWLPKPFGAEDLARALARWLAR